MACLSDAIEAHLLELLTSRDELELQRSELAARFGCAPSQINYVLVTRFTRARGFLVESRRGGGGYIRLVRLPVRAFDVVRALPEAIDQATAEHHVDRLVRAELLTAREGAMLRAIVAREVLALPLPLRDQLRAAILRAAVEAVLRAEGWAEGRDTSPPAAQRGVGPGEL